MARNICKRTRDTERPGVPADRVGVYPTLQAMIDAHRGASVRSWTTPDDDPAVVEVRDRLRMAPLTPKGVGCAYPGCRTTVTAEDHCAGCDEYTCERHSTNFALMGFTHEVAEHWTPDDEEDER